MGYNFKFIENKKLFPIIPVSENKKPLVEWKKEENHIKDIKSISKYKNSSAYATITGKPSGVMVIDIDNKGKVNGHTSFMEVIETLKIQKEDLKTLTIRTPNNGMHLYFKYREGLKTVSNIIPGVDIRTDGGIIIAPNSFIKRKDGKYGTYQVNRDLEIAEMPNILFDFLQGKLPKSTNKENKKKTNKTVKKELSDIYKICPENSRNESLFKYCCRMIRLVKDKEELFFIADMYNQRYLDPPLDQKEVENTVNSAKKYFTRPYLDDNGRVIVGALVKHILKEKPNYVKGNNLYIYNEKLGIYDYLDTQDQYRIYYDVADKLGTDLDIDNTKAEKFAKTIHQFSKRFIGTEDEKRYIACSNGIIDSFENKLLPFDPKYKLDCKFNGKFNPNYDEWLEAYNNSKFKDFLGNILLYDDVIDTLQDMWGLMLCPNASKTQQVFIYKGNGSNGKSSLFDIQEALFYDKNKSICGIGLQAFNEDKFILSSAEGKRVNIVRDDKFADEVGGAFKSAVCGEEVVVQKKHKDHIRTCFNLTWFFGMNTLPNTKDKTWGFYRRNCIIPFDVTFGTEEEVKQGKANMVKVPGIVDEIIEKELDIIFMWAYWGLQRVIKNKYIITPNRASELAMEEYRSETDSVYAFYKDNLIKKNGSKIKATELYNSYLKYCEDEIRPSVSSINFGKQMEQLGHKKYKNHGVMVFPNVNYQKFKEVDKDKNPF